VYVCPSAYRSAELLDEHGLADAGLAGDNGQAALPADNLIEQGVQLLECSLPLQQLHSATLWTDTFLRA
jgi:hypothetical protein